MLALINKDHRTITSLPLSYTFGMSIINTHLAVGSLIYLSNFSVLQKEFWQIFFKKKINFLYGVPYTFEILEKLNFFKKKISNLIGIAQAGGKLDEKLQKKIVNYSIKNNNKFFVMYGQAEATTRISYVPHNKIKKKIGSIGIPIKEGKMKIIKVKNSKSDVGEIYYEGPNVCMGYASNFHDLKKKIFGEELYLLEILVKRIGMVIFILLEEKKDSVKFLEKV